MPTCDTHTHTHTHTHTQACPLHTHVRTCTRPQAHRPRGPKWASAVPCIHMSERACVCVCVCVCVSPTFLAAARLSISSINTNTNTSGSSNSSVIFENNLDTYTECTHIHTQTHCLRVCACRAWGVASLCVFVRTCLPLSENHLEKSECALTSTRAADRKLQHTHIHTHMLLLLALCPCRTCLPERFPASVRLLCPV